MPLRLIHSASDLRLADTMPDDRLSTRGFHRLAALDGHTVASAGPTIEAPEPGRHPGDHASQAEPGLASPALPSHSEEQDLALVRAAAGKAAAALNDVRVLLGRDRVAWRREALARCQTKGWIAVQDGALEDRETFRVTVEGYRAAGLRVPPFTV